MDFDIRRADLVKMSIKSTESGQEIISDCLGIAMKFPRHIKGICRGMERITGSF